MSATEEGSHDSVQATLESSFDAEISNIAQAFSEMDQLPDFSMFESMEGEEALTNIENICNNHDDLSAIYNEQINSENTENSINNV